MQPRDSKTLREVHDELVRIEAHWTNQIRDEQTRVLTVLTVNGFLVAFLAPTAFDPRHSTTDAGQNRHRPAVRRSALWHGSSVAPDPASRRSGLLAQLIRDLVRLRFRCAKHRLAFQGLRVAGAERLGTRGSPDHAAEAAYAPGRTAATYLSRGGGTASRAG